MLLAPISLKRACAFVRQQHRHHQPPQGGLFALAAMAEGEIVGVAIVGRPVARRAQDGFTAEVTRVAVVPDPGDPTKGHKNACSFLYGACWRAAKAQGYALLITYTLPSESGASLRGAGWRCVGEAGGGSWSCPSRPREDKAPIGVKRRWEIGQKRQEAPRREAETVLPQLALGL